MLGPARSAPAAPLASLRPCLRVCAPRDQRLALPTCSLFRLQRPGCFPRNCLRTCHRVRPAVHAPTAPCCAPGQPVITRCLSSFPCFPGGSVGTNPPAHAGDLSMTPGPGRSPGEGMATIQHYCRASPVDRGAWRATVHRVFWSWTRQPLNNNAFLTFNSRRARVWGGWGAAPSTRSRCKCMAVKKGK